MTTKSILRAALLIFLSTIAAVSCKTTEKNYREAYERATAKNDRNVTEFENTIYNRYRGQMKDVNANLDGENVPTKLLRVKVTNDGGGVKEWLKKYSVVAAEFKQRFNANSMRSRLVEAGFPRTFLVENGEPYYYIVVDSSDDLAKIKALADSLTVSSPLPLKECFPYILQMPGR